MHHAFQKSNRRFFALLALFLSTGAFSADATAQEKKHPEKAQTQKENPQQKQQVDEDDFRFRWAGEQLYYSVRLNGVEAVRAGVRTGDVRYREGTPYVPVSGTAQSTGIFHNIYPVNDSAHTFVSPITLRPLRSEKFFDEAGTKRSYHVDYVHSTYRAKVLKKRHGKRRRKYTKAIPGTTNDMFTWFYELRIKQGLKVGEQMSYFVYDGWKLYRLDARVTKREDVYTPIGWFKAYRIDFSRETLRTRRNKGQSPILTVSKPAKPSGSLWVSRDENMIPVKVQVSTQWGVGEAVLIKYKLPDRD
jgi:hypothetical protein